MSNARHALLAATGFAAAWSYAIAQSMENLLAEVAV
jgi:hypothetical protein